MYSAARSFFFNMSDNSDFVPRNMATLPPGPPPDEPENLFEWLWRLRQYEADIFFRGIREGKGTSVSLKDATPQEWAAFVEGALERGMLPMRVVRDPEPPPPEEVIEMRDFRVSIPTPDGTGIANWVQIQIPVRLIPGVTPEGEEVLTPEAHDLIDRTKRQHMLNPQEG